LFRAEKYGCPQYPAVDFFLFDQQQISFSSTAVRFCFLTRADDDRQSVRVKEGDSNRKMETSVTAMTNIRGLRLTAIAMGSALAIALTTQAWANTAPTAAATISPSAVWEGETVTLNASSSHTNPPGDLLTYVWQQVAPTSPSIAPSPDNKTVVVTFTAPAVPLPNLTHAVSFKV
jgi:hypothetical protein